MPDLPVAVFRRGDRSDEMTLREYASSQRSSMAGPAQRCPKFRSWRARGCSRLAGAAGAAASVSRRLLSRYPEAWPSAFSLNRGLTWRLPAKRGGLLCSWHSDMGIRLSLTCSRRWTASGAGLHDKLVTVNSCFSYRTVTTVQYLTIQYVFISSLAAAATA